MFFNKVIIGHLNISSISSKFEGYTTQKMKFFIKDFFIKCDQIRSFLRIWWHLLKNSLMENFIFCAVIFAVEKNCDVLIISGTKLDDLFPTTNFMINEFTYPYRYERNPKDVELCSYIPKDIFWGVYILISNVISVKYLLRRT